MYSLVNSYYMDQPTNKLLIPRKSFSVGLRVLLDLSASQGPPTILSKMLIV